MTDTPTHTCFPDGRQEWRLNNNLHRLDGPAIIHSDGTQEWWVYGQDITDLSAHERLEILRKAKNPVFPPAGVWKV